MTHVPIDLDGIEARSIASLPGRSEFGNDLFVYEDGQRMLAGASRTIRPHDGETGSEFRRRVEAIVIAIDGHKVKTVELSEEIRAGIIVQAQVAVRWPPEPAPIQDDGRLAGGRPTGPRGTRGA
ncbi:hypothetical protein EKD04_017490 [Chloroflexales bacterium ZM16-3]|nr:hypothetical protein [Chloroflexales bacterium ZM16-3]